MRTIRLPTVADRHGFVAPPEALRQSPIQTFSIGVFKMIPTKDGKRLKRSGAKVRVQGLTHRYDEVLAKAHEVANQLDAGTYRGPKTIKVLGPKAEGLFTRTRAALEAYDASEPVREALWASADTTAEVREAEGRDLEATNAVREAFYEDTKAFNSWDNVFLLGMEDIRRMSRPKEEA